MWIGVANPWTAQIGQGRIRWQRPPNVSPNLFAGGKHEQSLAVAVVFVPSAKTLLRRSRQLALAAPRVEPVVDGPPWSESQESATDSAGSRIQPRPPQHGAGQPHHAPLRGLHQLTGH